MAFDIVIENVHKAVDMCILQLLLTYVHYSCCLYLHPCAWISILVHVSKCQYISVNASACFVLCYL